MPLDGITAKMLSFELNKELTGARIDKIYQPDAYDIYLRLRNANQNIQLIVSANPSTARIHLTNEIVDNPMVPLRFCTILRKYLSGGRILSIDTPGYERIFNIQIQTMNEIGDKDIKILVVEIMGRYSNIILLNENGRIIDAALHIDEKTSRVREVLPTRMYTPPLSQNKNRPEEVLEKIHFGCFFPTANELALSLNESPLLDQYLLDHMVGISPLFVQEICFQSHLDPKEHWIALREDQYASLRSTLIYYIGALLSAQYSPALFYQSIDSYSPCDFHAFSLHIFPYKKEFPSISSAMDEYYARKAKNNYLSQKKAYLVKLVSQKQALIARKVIIHNNDLEECRSMDQNKKYGDLILSSLHLIRPGQKELSTVDYYEEDSPSLVIPLQSTLSGSQNAQKYYKRYNKLKSKFESVSRLLEEEKSQLDYFLSVQISLSNVDSNTDIDAIKEELANWDSHFDQNTQKAQKKRLSSISHSKKKATSKKSLPIPPRRFRSSDGYEILVGRNNLQNDQLTTKISRKEDLWFHVQKAPGTHVIIKTNKEVPPDTTVEEAAMLAAWYSKSSDASINVKAVIDYCPAKNVWKPKGSTPGHVLYRDYSSITVKTLLPEKVKEIT